MLLEVFAHVIDGERPLDPEGPGERSSPFGVREAIEIKATMLASIRTVRGLLLTIRRAAFQQRLCITTPLL